jgi:hypothetical protein
LHPSLQQLVQEIRVSGVARKRMPDTTTTKSTSGKVTDKKGKSTTESEKSLKELADLKTGYEAEVQQGAILDGDALANELDALDFDGLSGDDDADNKADYGEDDDSLEDDEFDLR